jgi:hypothetical protein
MLVLPVMLLAMFMIIELARLLHAWLAVENGARFGIRYAVTGEYDLDHCPGKTCTTEQQIRTARIESIKARAIQGSQTIVRDLDLPPDAYVDDGYFKVTVCSGIDEPSTFRRSNPGIPPPADWTASCLAGDDPGEKGEHVWVTVDFNHPVISPLISSITRQTHLTARRDGIVETFGLVRDFGPGHFPTGTPPGPTATPPPTNTPLPPTQTNTPTGSPSPTVTYTATETATATPTPDCSLLSIGGLTVSNRVDHSRVEARVTNNNPPGLTAIHRGVPGTVFTWPVAGNMYLGQMRHPDTKRYWPVTVGGRDYSGSINGPVSNSGIEGQDQADWQARLYEVPAAGITGDFSLLLTYQFEDWPGTCTLTTTASLTLRPAPTVTASRTPTKTPSPTFGPPPTDTPTRTRTPTRTPTPVGPTNTPTNTRTATPVTPPRTPTDTPVAPDTPTLTPTKKFDDT